MEMELGTPAVAARKFWGAIHSLVYTLRNNLSSSSQSFLVDLHVFLKRTKSFPDLFLRHYYSFTCRPDHPDSLSFVSPSSLREVEFSCSNTPVNSNHHFLSFKKRRPSSRVHHLGGTGTGRARYGYGKKYNYDEAATVAAVQRVLEMLNRGGVGEDRVMASPMMLPGFGGGKSPAPVRQLRITDSPFPLNQEEDFGDDGGQVDVRAEEFIRNFYRDRREEKCMSPYYYGLWG